VDALLRVAYGRRDEAVTASVPTGERTLAVLPERAPSRAARTSGARWDCAPTPSRDHDHRPATGLDQPGGERARDPVPQPAGGAHDDGVGPDRGGDPAQLGQRAA
jgi:hypothetical protein